MDIAKNEILVIESRSAKDIYDDRYEGATLKEVLKRQNISAEHFKVINKKYFEKAIKYTTKESIKYVHFSGHGCEGYFPFMTSPLDQLPTQLVNE
ncbi:hypothetical protein OQJ65_10005 [Vibrio sp. Sgm 22]|uniref:hypothetical protein n=1 Tax=unclassified Vibrio TaxID=2614977 RepID=UPI00224923C2|nr:MULTISPECIES: hypothetical protein [unclassified Vibrio]MCX2758399.1 hypothetical protein [Vibrio sp. 14G-20]MCX2775640.1 hypothetical protein [Vibrio sp. Sgm 22]